MEAQIERAIEIAANPVGSSPQHKQEALDFVNQARQTFSPWPTFLDLALRQPRSSDVVRMFSLDIVNGAMQSPATDMQSRVAARDKVMQYVRLHFVDGNNQKDSKAIQNKVVQLLTSLFVKLYKDFWTTFFPEFLDLASMTNPVTTWNLTGTLLYLKLLNSIHDEIADVLVSRSADELQRHNELKDLVRERDIERLTGSWKTIMQNRRTDADTLAVIEQCLKTIGRWASWIDLSLILTQDLVSILYQIALQNAPACTPEETVRDTAMETINDILSKKMKGSSKLNLIETMQIKELADNIVASPDLTCPSYKGNYDINLAEIAAKLLNTVIVDALSIADASKDLDEEGHRAVEIVTELLPFTLRFTTDDYDEVASNTLTGLTDLLTLVRKRPALFARHSIELEPILRAVIHKSRYDSAIEWGELDDIDEAEFQELRKRLQVLQQAVAAIDESLYLDTISDVVASTFQSFVDQGKVTIDWHEGAVDWRDVDLALHEMFIFGELAVKSGGLYNRNKPVSPAAERLTAMMAKLVETGMYNYEQPTVDLQLMEICVRYSAFFDANPQHIPGILERFIRIVHHEAVPVKNRSWYFFFRFVKPLRQHLGGIAQSVISTIQDLLPIRAELSARDGSEDDDDMSSNEQDDSEDAKFHAQLYLYEALGCIASAHSLPVEQQVALVKSVMDPLYADLERHLATAKNGDERSCLQVHHLIMALGTLARGFSDWSPGMVNATGNAPAPLVSNEFTRAAEAILIALEALSSSADVRTAARFAFSRMIAVLGNRILPLLPRWIDGLLARTSSKDEMAMFLRLLNQVIFGFKSEIYDVLDALLDPFLSRVYAGITEPVSGTDDQVQLAELKAQYLAFLQVVLNNDLGSVLVSPKNQGTFEHMIAMLEHFTRDTHDYPTAKQALSVLKRMVDAWGGPDLRDRAANDVNGTSRTPAAGLPGFDRFMVERFSPLCWAMPLNRDFNSKDAQARQVLGEAASLQQRIYAKNGEAYVTWLREKELTEVGMDAATKSEYVQALMTSEERKFRQYFTTLVQGNINR